MYSSGRVYPGKFMLVVTGMATGFPIEEYSAQPTVTGMLDTTQTGVVNKTFHFGTTGDSPVIGKRIYN